MAVHIQSSASDLFFLSIISLVFTNRGNKMAQQPTIVPLVTTMASLLYLLLLPSVLPLSYSFTDGLLPNGDFERGPKKGDMKGAVVMGRRAIPEWEISGFVEFIRSGKKQGDMILVVPEGASAVRLGNDASIRHRLVNLTRGLNYAVTFSAARTCAQSEHLRISAAADSGEFPIQTLYSSSGWDSYSWAFMADSTTANFAIHNPGVDDDPACGPLIDAVAMKTLYPPPATNKNLVKNGDFEEGPIVLGNTTWGVLVPPRWDEKGRSPLPGWVVESLKAVKFIDAAHFSVPEGKRAVELVAGRESVVSQVVRTVPGKTYILWFKVGDAKNACRGSMVVEAHVGTGRGATVRVPYESSGSGGFKRAVLKFSADSRRTKVAFVSTFYHMRSDDLSSLCGPVVDDVRMLSVGVRS